LIKTTAILGPAVGNHVALSDLLINSLNRCKETSAEVGVVFVLEMGEEKKVLCFNNRR